MSVAIAFVGGFVAVAVLLAAAHGVLAHPSLQRQNDGGRVITIGAGLVLVLAVIAVDGTRTLLAVLGLGHLPTTPDRVVLSGAVVAFGFLGAVDDLLGDAQDRGLRGHLGAALHGRVTTGFVKLGGGAAIALVLAGAVDGDHAARVVVDAGLIALAANVANLLDRAPGRTIKWALLAFVPLALAAGTAAVGTSLAVVAGAALALLPGDLRERFMLGDTGANALGAALGVGAVLSTSPGVRTSVAVVLLLLTLVSELASFSRIIDRVPPLRGFDRLGRRRPGA